MAQYVIQPKKLMPYLPRGLELDLYQGRCYVSLVGFLFDRVRVKRLPIPFHTSFEEINLRFYVRRKEADGTIKRGVVFIREFVSRPAITFVANWLYEEPYATLPTRHRIEHMPQSLTVSYEWRSRDAWQSLAVEAASDAQPIATGSEEEFFTEHYWGYTKHRDGSTSGYKVQHPHWQTYPVRKYEISIDFGTLYGNGFTFLTDEWVTSVLLAEGSAVMVSAGRLIEAQSSDPRLPL